MVSPKCIKVLSIAMIVLALTAASWAAKKKKKEDETQILQLPKELPSAVVGETRRLAFYVTPLSAKGLLSQQIRDALKTLEREAGGNTVLEIRAFVAGTGDLRRVRDLVSETFSSRRQALPALSLIRVGGLPLEGAQVVLEAIAASRKDLFPAGLALIPAQTVTSENPLDPAMPLAEKSLEGLRTAVQSVGAEAPDVVRVTCFLSSFDNLAVTRNSIQAAYPHAALDFVEPERAPSHAAAACEAVAGLRAIPRAQAAGQSKVAVLSAPRVVLSSTQESFGYEERDARLAFERLGRALQAVSVSLHDVAFAHVYAVSRKTEGQARAMWPESFDPAHPPAASVIPVEGFPSPDAGFAVDVIAAKD